MLQHLVVELGGLQLGPQTPSAPTCTTGSNCSVSHSWATIASSRTLLVGASSVVVKIVE